MSASNEPLRLALLREAYCICRIDAAGEPPAWSRRPGEFTSVTHAEDQLSIVCPSAHVPAKIPTRSDGWRCLKVRGPLDLAITGVLARLVQPLAEAACPVFSISTYDTDYLLVREADLPRALGALRAAGHIVDDGPRHAQP